MRLFLALNPPPALRQRLGELADLAHEQCGGRRMPDASLHLTLAFLGEVEAAAAATLVDWVDGLTIAPGEWRLDAWGRFRRPGIVWVGGRHPDPALTALHLRLWEALEPRGFSRSGRFLPHVTLLRKARRLDCRGLPPIDLVWTYTHLELIESQRDERGARYLTLARSNGR